MRQVSICGFEKSSNFRSITCVERSPDLHRGSICSEAESHDESQGATSPTVSDFCEVIFHSSFMLTLVCFFSHLMSLMRKMIWLKQLRCSFATHHTAGQKGQHHRLCHLKHPSCTQTRTFQLRCSCLSPHVDKVVR